MVSNLEEDDRSEVATVSGGGSGTMAVGDPNLTSTELDPIRQKIKGMIRKP